VGGCAQQGPTEHREPRDQPAIARERCSAVAHTPGTGRSHSQCKGAQADEDRHGGTGQAPGHECSTRLPDLLPNYNWANEEVAAGRPTRAAGEDWLNAGHQSEVEALIGTAHQHLPGVAKQLRQAMNKLDTLKGKMVQANLRLVVSVAKNT